MDRRNKSPEYLPLHRLNGEENPNSFHNFQDFPPPENHPSPYPAAVLAEYQPNSLPINSYNYPSSQNFHLPENNPRPYSATAAGNQLNGGLPINSYNYPFFQDFQLPENNPSPYSAAAGNQLINGLSNDDINPFSDRYENFIDNTLFTPYPLLSDFNRLGLSESHLPPQYMAAASSYRGNRYSYEDMMASRNQYAAIGQLGFQQSPNYPQNSNPYSVNGNLNGIREYDLRRILNRSTMEYLPRNRNREIEELGFQYSQSPNYPYSVNGNLNSIREFDSRRVLNGEAMEYLPRTNRSPYNEFASLNSSRGHTSRFKFNYDSQYRDEYMNGTSNRSRPRNHFISYVSMEEVRGKILGLAKDQHGCRFLQERLEEGKRDEIRMIFTEIKDHVYELMFHQFGHYLVQNFFAVCDQELMSQILYSVINDERNLMNICLDVHGTRVLQKMIECIKPPQKPTAEEENSASPINEDTTKEERRRFTSALKRMAVPLAKSSNGHHVIQFCFKYFPIEDIHENILREVTHHCLDIAVDKNGCCVLQQCVEHVDHETCNNEACHHLITEITNNTIVLSLDTYGNYVVQHLLWLKKPYITAEILLQLAGNFVSLSKDKYGSNVVEKSLIETYGNQTVQIINELLLNRRDFLTILQDPFGNYVAQTALDNSRGMVIRQRMVNLIHDHHDYLHSHPHGKKVLAKSKEKKHHPSMNIM